MRTGIRHQALGNSKAKSFAFVVCALLFALILPAEARQLGRIPVVGMLRVGSPPDPLVEELRQGLYDLGYIEGKSIAIEYRWAEGKPDRIPELVAGLVRLKVDVIVVAGVPSVQAAKNATKTIPIIFTGMSADPVGAKFIASLARPGGNITGLSVVATELAGKRLELLKEAMPKASRLAALYDPATDPVQLQEMRKAVQNLGAQLEILEVRDRDGFEGAFQAAKTARIEAISVLPAAFFYAHRTHIVNLAAKGRLPAIYEHREFVEVGGLMSYGPAFRDMFRRAAVYVAKILKGVKPADLPVEQATKFELIINLKTAKQIGLTIPPNVLLRADKVIK